MCGSDRVMAVGLESRWWPRETEAESDRISFERTVLLVDAERVSSVVSSDVMTAICIPTKDSRCAPVSSDKKCVLSLCCTNMNVAVALSGSHVLSTLKTCGFKVPAPLNAKMRLQDIRPVLLHHSLFY